MNTLPELSRLTLFSNDNCSRPTTSFQYEAELQFLDRISMVVSVLLLDVRPATFWSELWSVVEYVSCIGGSSADISSTEDASSSEMSSISLDTKS